MWLPLHSLAGSAAPCANGSRAARCASSRARERPPDAYFDQLEGALRALHARGIAYNDLERKDNLLVDSAGNAVLIDFQLAASAYRGRSRALAALSRWWIRELQQQDLRYLFKRKRKLRPDLCTPEQLRLSRERSPLARAYHPLWRVLHGAKRLVLPKGRSRA
jgi:serine/threonine protein kinase